MNRLDEYKALIRRCYEVIGLPDWPQPYAELSSQAGQLYGMLTERERECVMGYQQQLYEARIK